VERKNRSVILDPPMSDEAKDRVLRIVGSVDVKPRGDPDSLSDDRLVSFFQKII